VRVDAPAGRRGPKVAGDEPSELPPRPGCLYKLLYAGSLLGFGLIALAVGFLAAFFFTVRLSMAIDVPLGPGLFFPTGLVISAGLIALVVAVHRVVFRERRGG
jgi:hypothetical protein